MEHIRSEDLTIDQVPDPDKADDGELWAFAHTFHAYTHWGGLQEAFDASQAAGVWQAEQVAAYELEHGEPPEVFPFPEPQLDHLRTSMFLDCRATRHCEQESDTYPDHFWSGLRHGVRAVRELLAV